MNKPVDEVGRPHDEGPPLLTAPIARRILDGLAPLHINYDALDALRAIASGAAVAVPAAAVGAAAPTSGEVEEAMTVAKFTTDKITLALAAEVIRLRVENKRLVNAGYLNAKDANSLREQLTAATRPTTSAGTEIGADGFVFWKEGGRTFKFTADYARRAILRDADRIATERFGRTHTEMMDCAKAARAAHQAPQTADMVPCDHCEDVHAAPACAAQAVQPEVERTLAYADRIIQTMVGSPEWEPHEARTIIRDLAAEVRRLREEVRQANILADAAGEDAERAITLAKKAAGDLESARSPNEEQMRRLNETVVRLNAENAALRAAHPATGAVRDADALRLDWLFSELNDDAIRAKLARVAEAHTYGGSYALLQGNTPIRVGDFRAAIDAAMAPTGERK